jgi:predicted exporter
VANGESAFGAAELALIERYRYQLSDRVDAAHFEVAQLRAALEERLEGLSGGGGALEKRWLANDPTGETLHVLARIAPQMQPRRFDGVVVRARRATPRCSSPRRSRRLGLRGAKARDCRRRTRLRCRAT